MDQSESLTSDTFLCFFEKLKEKVNIKNPRAYLYGIAKVLLNKYLKRKYLEVIIDFQDLDLIAYRQKLYSFQQPNKQELPSLSEKVLQHLSLLPAKQQNILTLRFQEKLRPTEICRLIGKDMNYVKTTQKRALKNLKKIISS